MRSVLRGAPTPSHISLALDGWAPVSETDGKVPDKLPEDQTDQSLNRDKWLDGVLGISVDRDYQAAFDRWKASFTTEGDCTTELTLTSRLLVGHGNPSATDVGITVHHTWGVPIIPGSALKGLLAHYIDAVYGPDEPGIAPWAYETEDQQKRAAFQGITWDKNLSKYGPGEVYRALFGAPESAEDDAARAAGYPAGATRGLVTFHDALYVPGSIADNKPYAADVLTVHHKQYYNSIVEAWANDYDDPNPVSFVTVKPGAKLLLVLSGPAEWTKFAAELLADALHEWGVGGKTSLGYGRFEGPPPPPPPSWTRSDKPLLVVYSRGDGTLSTSAIPGGKKAEVRGDKAREVFNTLPGQTQQKLKDKGKLPLFVKYQVSGNHIAIVGLEEAG